MKGDFMLDWMLMPYKRYVDFAGRSRRKEYWMFFLFTFLVGFVINIIGAVGQGGGLTAIMGIVGLIFQLGSLLPSIAVAIRRMHDQDRSGWWIICPIANIIFLFIEGTKGPNRFGPDPKDPGSAEAFS